ncbi:MAG: 50S ribosomal protein L17 [Dehalococcoidia bacterium]|nr:50S ribosomal protein L17 [Dehalococcoidia bacterium]
MAGRKLSRSTSHRVAMYRNQVTDLLKYGKIVTTEAKAKEVRSLAEKMVTLGKAGNLSARRQALAYIYSEDVVNKVFSEIAPRYADRAGGYTRMLRLGTRLGDAATVVQLELV